MSKNSGPISANFSKTFNPTLIKMIICSYCCINTSICKKNMETFKFQHKYRHFGKLCQAFLTQFEKRRFFAVANRQNATNPTCSIKRFIVNDCKGRFLVTQVHVRKICNAKMRVLLALKSRTAYLRAFMIVCLWTDKMHKRKNSLLVLWIIFFAFDTQKDMPKSIKKSKRMRCQ